MADILQIVWFVYASNYNDWCIMWWGLMKFLVYLFVSSLLWMPIILTCNFLLSFVMHTFIQGNYTIFNLVHLFPHLLYSILSSSCASSFDFCSYPLYLNFFCVWHQQLSWLSLPVASGLATEAQYPVHCLHQPQTTTLGRWWSHG